MRRFGIAVPIFAVLAAASLLGLDSEVTATPGHEWPRKGCGQPIAAAIAGDPNPYLNEGLLPKFDVPPPPGKAAGLNTNFRDSCVRRSRVRVAAAIVWAAGFAVAAAVCASRRLRLQVRS